MDISQSILSDITVYMKYAKYTPELERRELWNELIGEDKKKLKEYINNKIK